LLTINLNSFFRSRVPGAIHRAEPLLRVED
jgi:hypothetical protein